VRTLEALGGIVLLVGAAVFFTYGTVSPCGVLRETVRQHDDLAAVLPDGVVDLALAGQYGALSPGRCLGILLEQQGALKPAQAIQQPVARQQPPQTTQPAPAPVTAQDPMQWAAQMTVQANNECRAKRLRGELPTHVASVQCSNPTMITAFNEAHYRYMDLIEFFAAKRLELAAKIDRGELTEQQAQLDGNKAYAAIQETERRRNSGAR
jgi:hypothetical protein